MPRIRPFLIWLWPTVLIGAVQAPVRPRYLLTVAEIRSVAHAEDIGEVIRETRPCWFSFNGRRDVTDFRPPNPCSFSLDFRAPRASCQIRLYLDNERVFGALNLVCPDDVGEVRLYPPGAEWVIGDTVVHTGDCPIIHVVRIGAWYELRDHRDAVLSELEKAATPVKLREVPVALRPFGFAWDFEGPRRLLFRMPERPACGSIDLPTIASSDTLSGPARRAL